MRNWNQGFKACLNVLLFISSSMCLANDQAYLEKEYFDVNHSLKHAKIIEDKVYIQSDNIYLSPNQIYVRIEGDLIPIQHLSCDGNGVFTSIQDIQAGRGKQETWICPNEECGYENYDGIDYCGICGTYRYEKHKQKSGANINKDIIY